MTLEELGAGGFGNVDLVRFVDEGMARACKMPPRVALKRVFMGKQVTVNMKLQVQKEALFLKELPSTHFIKLYHSFFEVNEHGNWYFYLVMEHASRGDLLSNLIKKAKLNERIIEEKEIWRICCTVGQGLKMLHAKNIVHKDIKP